MTLRVSDIGLITQYQQIKGNGRDWRNEAARIVNDLTASIDISWDRIINSMADAASLITILDATVGNTELQVVAQEQEADPAYDFLAECAAASIALKDIRAALVAGEFPRIGDIPQVYHISGTAQITTDTVNQTAIPNTLAAYQTALTVII